MPRPVPGGHGTADLKAGSQTPETPETQGKNGKNAKEKPWFSQDFLRVLCILYG
jgi:hypothetical protein